MKFAMWWNIALIMILFLLAVSFWGFYSSIRPSKIVSAITPADLNLAFEPVTLKTRDGVSLAGWYMPHENAEAQTIIALHGYPADKGDVLPAIAFLRARYNLLLFDFRYLGSSQGTYSTAGMKEVMDLEAAVQYLKSRGVNRAGVWGFSMGGAVALMGAARLPEIQAVVSESSYARLDLMASELFPIPLIRIPLAKLTLLWARLFLGADIRDASPARAAEQLQIPVLLIHSTNDRVIPLRHAKLLQESLARNPRAEFWFEENLAHGQLGDRYQERVLDFFEKNL